MPEISRHLAASLRDLYRWHCSSPGEVTIIWKLPGEFVGDKTPTECDVWPGILTGIRYPHTSLSFLSAFQ
jgi:hypothetical protein